MPVTKTLRIELENVTFASFHLPKGKALLEIVVLGIEPKEGFEEAVRGQLRNSVGIIHMFGEYRHKVYTGGPNFKGDLEETLKKYVDTGPQKGRVQISVKPELGRDKVLEMAQTSCDLEVLTSALYHATGQMDLLFGFYPPKVVAADARTVSVSVVEKYAGKLIGRGGENVRTLGTKYFGGRYIKVN